MDLKWYEAVGYSDEIDISRLEGEVIKEVLGLEEESEEVVFKMESGNEYCLVHIQDCCEDVRLIDWEISSHNLEGGLIILSEKRSNTAENDPDVYDSGTYTFYNIQTTKGTLDMRWLGESNGYYGEEVSLFKKPEKV